MQAEAGRRQLLAELRAWGLRRRRFRGGVWYQGLTSERGAAAVNEVARSAGWGYLERSRVAGTVDVWITPTT